MTDRIPQADAPAPAPALAGELWTELQAVYHELDRAVARLGPVCLLSGRCCRFEAYGHTLYLSAVEAEFLVDRAAAPQRPLDGGKTCPWQDERGHCTARDARPLGCRVYYCDPAYQPAAADLSEQFISRLKQLSVRHDRPWDYAPLHRHLTDARSDGRLSIDLERTTLDTNPSHQYT